MGFLSDIGDAIGDVVGGVGDFFGSGSGKGLLGLGQLAGNLFGNQQRIGSAQAAMDFSAAQTANQMAFQERMRNTSYQAAVNDLKAAGLNPMLAYTQGGAAVPSGGAASGNVADVRDPTDGVGQAVVSAAQAKLMTDQAKQVQAQTEVANADADLKRSQSFKTLVDVDLSRSQQDLNHDLRKVQQAMIPKIAADTVTSQASAEQIRSQNLLMKDLMANPVTRPFAPLLNLIFKN